MSKEEIKLPLLTDDNIDKENPLKSTKVIRIMSKDTW